MANRFYQTTEGRFVDDKMYQAPWELMQAAINTHETRTDKLVSEAGLLTDAVDNINFLDIESEKERVKALQDKYESQINDLTQQIMQNPLEYQRQMPALKKAQREMTKDKLGGEWSQIEGRASAVAKWVEENKDQKAADPILYRRLYNKFINDLESELDTNPAAKWQAGNVITRPDVMSSLETIMKNIKGNATTYNDKTGAWMIDGEELTEQEIHDIALNKLRTDPNFAGYSQQMMGLGDEGYDVSPYMYMNRETGESLGYDAFAKLTPEERAKYTRAVNQDHAFAPDLNAMGKIYGYREEKYTANPYKLKEADYQYDSALKGQQQEYDMEKLEAKRLAALELERLRQQGDIDSMIAANKIEKGLALSEDNVALNDQMNVVLLPHKVITAGEQKEQGQRYLELKNKQANGTMLSPKEEIEWQTIKPLYDKIAGEHGEKIMRYAGESTEGLTPEQITARASEIWATTLQVRADDSFGVKAIPVSKEEADRLSRSKDSAVLQHSQKYDRTVREKYQNVIDGIAKDFENFDDFVANSMTIAKPVYPVNSKSQVGEVMMGTLNSLHLSGMTPFVMELGTTLYDAKGEKRKTQVGVDVDESMWTFGTTSTPLTTIINAYEGVATPQDLIDKGYFTVNSRIEGGELIFDFTATPKGLEEGGFELQTAGSTENVAGFGLNYGRQNMDAIMTPIVQKSNMSAADMQNMFDSMSPTFSAIQQKVDVSVAELRSKGVSKAYMLPNGDWFKMETNDAGEYNLFFKDQEDKRTWDQMRKEETYFTDTDDKVIKRFLDNHVNGKINIKELLEDQEKTNQ